MKAMQSLRYRVPLAVLAVFVAVLGIFYIALYRVVLDSYEDIERTAVADDLTQAQRAFMSSTNRLEATAADWAIWTDTYRFMAGEYPEYRDKNLVEETLTNLDLDFMALCTQDDRVVWSATMGSSGERFAQGDGDTERSLHDSLPLVRPLSPSKPRSGLVLLDGEPMVFASLGITDNGGRSPSNGYLVLGSYVGADEARYVHRLSGLTVEFDKPNQPVRASAAEQPVTVQIRDERTIVGFKYLIDSNRMPVVRLSVARARTAQDLTAGTMINVAWALLASIVTFAIALDITLESTILRRLGRLHAFIQVAGRSDETAYSKVGGRDEVAGLAAALDNALLTAAESEEKLRHQVDHDYLTGLANRRYLEREAARSIAEARRSQTRVALLAIDLNGFKKLNDTAGHQAGDEALVCFTQRALSVVRDYSTLARTGGDEFVILLPNSDRSDAERVAARLHEALSEAPCSCAGTEITLAASVGIAVFPTDGESLDALTRVADAEMYEAKRNGGATR